MSKIVDSHQAKLETLREGILRSLTDTRDQHNRLLGEVTKGQIPLSQTSEVISEYQILLDAAIKEHEEIQHRIKTELTTSRHDLCTLKENQCRELEMVEQNHHQSMEQITKERDKLTQSLQAQQKATQEAEKMANDAQKLIHEVKTMYDAGHTREDDETITAHQSRQQEMQQVIDQLNQDLNAVRKGLEDCQKMLGEAVSKQEDAQARLLDANNSISQMTLEAEGREIDLQDIRVQRGRIEIENNATIETLRSDMDALLQQIRNHESQRIILDQQVEDLRTAQAGSVEAAEELRRVITSAEQAKLNFERAASTKGAEVIKLKEKLVFVFVFDRNACDSNIKIGRVESFHGR